MTHRWASRKTHRTLMHITGNCGEQWKSLKLNEHGQIHGNQWKSWGNQWTSMKHENVWKFETTHERNKNKHQWTSMTIHEHRWKPIKINKKAMNMIEDNGNQWHQWESDEASKRHHRKLIKFNENHGFLLRRLSLMKVDEWFYWQGFCWWGLLPRRLLLRRLPLRRLALCCTVHCKQKDVCKS